MIGWSLVSSLRTKILALVWYSSRVPDYINLCRRKSKRLHDHDVEILEEQTQFCTNHEKYADMCSLDRLELTASALNDRLHELKIPH
jgi:hypothetical protein